VPETVRAHERERRELSKRASSDRAGAGADAIDVDALAARAAEVDGVPVLAAAVEVPDAKALLTLADHLRGRLGDAAIALGTVADGRVHLLVSVAPALVERGVKAGAVVKVAAEKVGGGGGGRDTLAQAGGRDAQRLDEAIDAAEDAIIAALEA
jgi:alanyl-tRNA synthetase